MKTRKINIKKISIPGDYFDDKGNEFYASDSKIIGLEDMKPIKTDYGLYVYGYCVVRCDIL